MATLKVEAAVVAYDILLNGKLVSLQSGKMQLVYHSKNGSAFIRDCNQRKITLTKLDDGSYRYLITVNSK